MVSKHQYEAHERRIAAGDQQVVNPMYFVAFCSSTQCYLQSKACRKRSDVARLTTLVNTQRTCTSWTSWSVWLVEFDAASGLQWEGWISGAKEPPVCAPWIVCLHDFASEWTSRRRYWMHIECTLNAHWLCWLCSCSNAILGAVQTIVLSALCSGSVLCQGQDSTKFLMKS